MKTLLLTVTVTATALMLAATSFAVGEAKYQSPFTRSVKLVRIHTNTSLSLPLAAWEHAIGT